MKYKIISISGLYVAASILTACGSSSGSSSGDDSADTPNDDPVITQVEEDSSEASDSDTQDNSENLSDGELPAAITPTVNIADIGSSLFYRDENNSARLTGPVFGQGAMAGADVFERIEVFGPVTSPDGEIVAAFSTRQDSSINSDLTQIVVVMHNTSNSTVCNPAYPVHVVNKDGSRVKRDGSDSVEEFRPSLIGTSFESTTISETLGELSFIRCISPGDLAYGRFSVGTLSDDDTTTRKFGLQAGLTWTGNGEGFNSIGETDFGTSLAEPVVPLSYTVNEAGVIEALVENQSNRAAEISGDAIALSSEGFPMIRMNSDNTLELEAGESGILEFSSSNFLGSSSTLRVILDID